MGGRLEELVGRLVQRDAPRSEATVQADVRQLLLEAPLGLTEEVLLETHTEDHRRIDVEVGATVIEVKRDLRSGSVRVDAMDQLRGYVEARQRKHGTRYVGILTDGAEWHCYHLRATPAVPLLEKVASISIDTRRPDHEALLVWLEGVLATARDLRPTPDEIQRRLGARSSSHALDRATVRSLFQANRESPAVVTKRRLWARLLETALGTQFEDSDELFIEHTLLVNSADIVAHAVLGLHPENLAPRSVLYGGEFDAAGVLGVVEADFFDWVVDVPEGDKFVRALCRRIARFDWAAVEHDVLKVLYESIIVRETRKKLGEYYTPDWLAEEMIRTSISEPLATRVLDPACGSGTFLFHAVRRFLHAADSAGQGTREMLDGVTNSVIGMDLHPVAVSLARVTYLLAIGRDRLMDPRRGPIRVPVFLGDSLQWRRKDPDLWSKGELAIPVEDRRDLITPELKFPSTLLADSRRFDDLVTDLADLAAKKKPSVKPPPLAGVFRNREIPADQQPMIAATFQTMCRLHDEGRDHIWGYYVRNLARPEWLARTENRVDLLVGNPPWLAFRHMPAEMQGEFREMSEQRGLWQGQKVATHQDLSALFAVRSIELYLKPGGRFAFVMPSAVIDRKQFSGFRSGNYLGSGRETCAAFGSPWDLRRLRPHFFPITASVIFGNKAGQPAPMGRPGEVWKGRLPARNASWGQVAPLVIREMIDPIGHDVPGTRKGTSATRARSPYHPRFRQGATLVPRVLFMVEARPAGPLGQVVNRMPVRSARSASEKAPWRGLDSLEGVVENEFVYRVHLGETILPFRALEPKRAVLPIDHRGNLLRDDVVAEYSGLSDWMTKAEGAWEAHRKSSMTLAQQIDYHGKLTDQFPLVDRRVVYNASGMHLSAARVMDHRAVVEHSLYWAAVSSELEAWYLLAILNSVTITRAVRPLMAYGKDERHVDKYVWQLSIPGFDSARPVHSELAELGRAAETLVAQLPLRKVHFSSLRREIRAALATSAIGPAIELRVARLIEA